MGSSPDDEGSQHGQLAASATLDALEEELKALRLVAPRFSIETRRIPRRRMGTTVAKTRIADCIAGVVSVEDPQLRLMLVVSSLGYRVLVDTEAEENDADWRVGPLTTRLGMRLSF